MGFGHNDRNAKHCRFLHHHQHQRVRHQSMAALSRVLGFSTCWSHRLASSTVSLFFIIPTIYSKQTYQKGLIFHDIAHLYFGTFSGLLFPEKKRKTCDIQQWDLSDENGASDKWGKVRQNFSIICWACGSAVKEREKIAYFVTVRNRISLVNGSIHWGGVSTWNTKMTNIHLTEWYV